VVALTRVSLKGDEQRAFGSGLRRYITKPITLALGVSIFATAGSTAQPSGSVSRRGRPAPVSEVLPATSWSPYAALPTRDRSVEANLRTSLETFQRRRRRARCIRGSGTVGLLVFPSISLRARESIAPQLH